MLAVDETGFLKKGRMSAGVARQYTGTAGRVENCQVGVFLAYARRTGARALIDRELYLPEKWAEDRDRCRAAGIGDEVAFATKPQLAREDDRARGGRRACRLPGWPGTRSTAATRSCGNGWRSEKIGYVLAVACRRDDRHPGGAAARGRAGGAGARGRWQRLSCADGSKGPRLYDWALIGTASADRWLLVRRSLHPGEKGELELAFFPAARPGR